MKRTDGLEDYTLGKDYGENKAGSVIPVDPERKKWLDENGFRGSVETPVTPDVPIPSPVPSSLPRRRRGEGV